MKREDILVIYKAGPEAVIELVNLLTATVLEQLEQITALQERVKALEDQLNKNSCNSNKPPSTDRFFKPKSQRQKSDKPVGGQTGHIGHTLKMVDNPDYTITHRATRCTKCGHSLEETVEPPVMKDAKCLICRLSMWKQLSTRRRARFALIVVISTELLSLKKSASQCNMGPVSKPSLFI